MGKVIYTRSKKGAECHSQKNGPVNERNLSVEKKRKP